MRIVVPITGELIASKSGNPDNPVKPLDFRKLLPKGLDNFAWEAINYDFEAGVVELEITFSPKEIPTKFNDKVEVIETRFETQEEFSQRRIASENALRNVLREHTIDELHQMTGEQRLIKPFKGK